MEVAASFEGLPKDTLRVAKAPGQGYNVDYTLNKTGKYSLTVDVVDAPVKGSPFTVEVLPAVADLDNFVFEGKSNVASGEKSSFQVIARDK